MNLPQSNFLEPHLIGRLSPRTLPDGILADAIPRLQEAAQEYSRWRRRAIRCPWPHIPRENIFGTPRASVFEFWHPLHDPSTSARRCWWESKYARLFLPVDTDCPPVSRARGPNRATIQRPAGPSAGWRAADSPSTHNNSGCNAELPRPTW